MPWKSTFWRCVLIAFAFLYGANPAFAGGIYAQLNFTFNEERPFAYRYDKGDHSLVLELKNTATSELDVLDHYDERLIRRVLIKDMSPIGTEVKLVLRDRNVRAHVNQFAEPFRISIDIFDADYEEERDPQTGLPMIGSTATNNDYASAGQASAGQLLMPDQDVSAGGIAPPSSVGQSPAKRRLLQPAPQAFVSAGELSDAISQAKAGVGPAWNTFPDYIYRIQTAPYEGESNANTWNTQAAAKAVTSVEAMASYAGQLFNLGHENKALVAYQQVLHKDASIFERDALHLWKFAEIHMGQGNQTLARGYFQALADKHPQSPLARFAQLRILDIAAVRLIQRDEYAKTPVLRPELDKLSSGHNGELAAQIAIRKAYWSKQGLAETYDPKHLPAISRDVYDELASSYGIAESRRTKFYASNLLLGKMLEEGSPWTTATGEFAANYMQNYQGDSVEPYRGTLNTKLIQKISANLQSKVTDGRLVEAIRDYEALPRSLRRVERSPRTAWALAEAYRKLGRESDAVSLYETAAKDTTSAPERFKAEFWLAVTAGKVAGDMVAGNKSDAQVKRLQATSRRADRDMAATWNALNPEEKEQINTIYKADFEKTIGLELKLQTPPRLILQNWTEALSTKTSVQTEADPVATDLHYSPSGSAVILLTNLAKRFAELGMTKERRESLQLLRFMKPSDLEDDQAAKKIWADELIGLAEDYRKNSQFLDAGRLYSLVGKESQNWEGRAESLYKGGLLLYRSGRRQEAITALQEAANDGNNLYYANLARERLAQIE